MYEAFSPPLSPRLSGSWAWHAALPWRGRQHKLGCVPPPLLSCKYARTSVAAPNPIIECAQAMYIPQDANCQAPHIRDETSQVWTVRWTASHGLGVLCQTAKSMLCHSPSQAWFVLHWIFNTALGSHTNLGHNTAFPGPTKEVTPLQGRSKTEQEAWEDGKTRRKRLSRHCSACA